MSDSVITLLKELVSIDSVNPSLAPDGGGEGKIATRLADEMRAIGLRVEVDEVVPGRPNVVGVLTGRKPGRSLMLCGHMDTVGVVNMENPFIARETHDRMYGRGTQDMKSGLAAIVDTARQLVKGGGLDSGRLIVAAVVDEEHSSLGASQLVTRWRADAAVVAEPTDLGIAVGHRGFSWIEITTRGLAAHGSCPKLGRDAIFYMARVLQELESLNDQLQRELPHPVQGVASLHASIVSGGRELSTYPDQCLLQMERRTTSDEPHGIALAEVERILGELRARDSQFEASARQLLDRSPFQTPANHPLPQLLATALYGIGREPAQTSVPFWTDAAILAGAGIPSVIFGPGGEGMHSRVEYVRLEEVLLCRDVLVELTRSFLADTE